MKDFALVVAGGLLGFAASIGQQILSHRHSQKVQRVAIERALLSQVQESTLALLRATYGWHSRYLTEYKRAREPGPGRPPATHEGAHSQAMQLPTFQDLTDARSQLRLLASQVRDRELREAVFQYADECTLIGSASDFEDSYEVINDVDQRYRELLNMTGARLREIS